jgi:hypothetical protein
MVVVIDGPLAPWAPGLAQELSRLGYTTLTAVGLMRLVGRLSCWLGQRDMGVVDLTEEAVEDFLGSVRAKPTGRSLAWLLGYLREIGVVAEPTVTPPG